MYVIEGETVDELYVRALAIVIAHGRPVAPRGLPTREVFPASLVLHQPRARVLGVAGRTINPAFAVAETLWILSGSDAPWIFDFNNRLRRYANDGRLAGAYGPRLRAFAGCVDQLERARAVLASDRVSRQAVIQIYDPASVRPEHRDVPCTLAYRFLVRDDRLHSFCTMRSQDLWLGFPYDVFFGTVLQELLAGWLGVEPGAYYHAVDSLHLYEADLALARQVHARGNPGAAMRPLELEWVGYERALAEAIAGTLPADHPLAPFMLVLRSYRSWRGGAREAAAALAAAIDGPLGEATQRWYRHLDGAAALRAAASSTD